MSSWTVSLALISALLLGSAALVDPTQPPAILERVAGDAPGSNNPRPEAGGPRVTSIVLSPERRLAVIDGARVTIGDRVGAARVEDISLTAVHLRGPDGPFDLPLYATPAVKLPPDREAP